MRVLLFGSSLDEKEIGKAFSTAGHSVDFVDNNRGVTPIVMTDALIHSYDLVSIPVDTDAGYLHPSGTRIQAHHETVRYLLGRNVPQPMIEITGAHGKTATAHALAHILGGPGVLHTSAGTFAFPEKDLLFISSIAPASVLSAARFARDQGGFLIAEESFGVTGAGDLAIVTSWGDHPSSAGKNTCSTPEAHHNPKPAACWWGRAFPPKANPLSTSMISHGAIAIPAQSRGMESNSRSTIPCLPSRAIVSR